MRRQRTQEASRADIGIAGGVNQGLLFKKGKMVRTIPQDRLFEELVKEIDEFVANEKNAYELVK